MKYLFFFTYWIYSFGPCKPSNNGRFLDFLSGFSTCAMVRRIRYSNLCFFNDPKWFANLAMMWIPICFVIYPWHILNPLYQPTHTKNMILMYCIWYRSNPLYHHDIPIRLTVYIYIPSITSHSMDDQKAQHHNFQDFLVARILPGIAMVLCLGSLWKSHRFQDSVQTWVKTWKDYSTQTTLW